MTTPAELAVAVAHLCHWPGCTVEVEPRLWGCRAHWYRLPQTLRARIWGTYRPGQEIDKQPSSAYLKAATAVQDWVAQFMAEKHERPCRHWCPNCEANGLQEPR